MARTYRNLLLSTSAVVFFTSTPAVRAEISFTGINFVNGTCTSSAACTITDATLGSQGTGGLTVNSDSDVTVSNSLTVGFGANGRGSMVLTGAGSSLVTGGGTGAGSTGTFASSAIGTSGATGSVTVSNGATWTLLAPTGGTDLNAAFLAVGRNAGSVGTLSIESGGRVLIQDLGSNTADEGITIGGTGGNANGAGFVNVSGSNSLLSINSRSAVQSYLHIGRNGTSASGALTVTNGGDVSVTAGAGEAYVSVGRNGARGDLTVDGAGSSLILTGLVSSTLHIGRESTGTAAVTNGAIVTVGDGTGPASIAIGRDVGGNGALTVSGPGSTLSEQGSSSTSFDIGRAGTGAVEVRSGGAITLASQAGANLTLGREASTGVGSLTVSGTNSRVSLAGTGTQDQSVVLQVGRNGSGTMLVEAGGAVSVDAGQTIAGVQIGRDTGSTGTLTVTGLGSSLTVSGSGAADTPGSFFQVGRGGTGTMNVLDGATVTYNTGVPVAASLSIGGNGTAEAVGTGTVLVSGRGSSLTLQGSSPALVVGLNGMGTLTVGDNATVSTLDLSVGNQAGGTGNIGITTGGTVRLSGTDSRNGEGAQGAIGQAGTGTLAITSGGTLTIDTSGGANGGLFVGAESGGRGTVLLSGSGTRLDAGAEFGIGYIAGSAAEGGTGNVAVNDGATLRATTVRLGSSGGSSALSKVLSFNSTGRVDSANVIVNPGGVLIGTGTVTGHVTLNGGTLTTGSSVGTMTIGNGLTVNSGTIEVKVNGRTAGSYDVYAVTGTAEVNGGTVLVVFADSFRPAEGERFNVIQATGGITGTGVTTVQTNVDGVTASVVPAAQTGGVDIVIVGGTATAAQEAEATISTTAEQQTRSVVRTVVAAVSGRVREAMAARRDRATAGIEAESGMAAGNGGSSGLAAWADGGASRLINSQNGGKFDGWGRTLLVGADYTVGSFVLGGAVGLERSTLSIQQNDGDRKAHGGSLVAYAGYLIDETFSADVQVAAGRLSNRLREMRGGVVDTGDFNSNRLIVAANLTAVHTVSDWTMTGIVGTSFSRERFESYSTDAGLRVDPGSVYLGQVRVGGELSYALSPAINPYVAASYEVDVRSSENGDRNGAVLGAGLRASLADNFTVGVFGSAQVLRRDDENYAIAVNGRYSF